MLPVASIAVAAMALIAGQAAASGRAPASNTSPPAQSQGVEHQPACGPVPAGYARCHARVVVNRKGGVPGPPQTTTTLSTTTTAPSTTSTTAGSTTTTAAPTTTTTASTTTTTALPSARSAASCPTPHSGYGPCDLLSAYNLSGTAGGTPTIAIVDAYDNPNAESDLAAYRLAYGLSPCTTANGCFKKIDQNGGSSYPRGDVGWGEEIALDLDMASAICQNCHILLVTAASNSIANLVTAEQTAANQPGVVAVSNSWGAGEFSSESAYDGYFAHAGVAYTASSGDSGYGVEWPAASAKVTAVGGTHLAKSAGQWTETVWSGAGSGCSGYITKPSWQLDTGCAKRTVADVSAVADPNTGVAVYDSYGAGGWLVFGGTSVASPIVAAVYALSGKTTGSGASLAYSHTASLFDVVSGSNGSCAVSYLCHAAVGFDGPTGLGTPNGVLGF